MKSSGNMTRSIMRGIALMGIITIVFSSPYAARSIIGEVKRQIKIKARAREFYNRLYHLRQRKIIDWREKGNMIEISLSETGQKQILRFNIEELRLIKPKRWDGKWRLVFSDIPESRKQARDAMRSKFQELGMLQFNKSVWVYPYPCEKEVDFVVSFFEVEKYVHYAVAGYISNTETLKQYFNL